MKLDHVLTAVVVVAVGIYLIRRFAPVGETTVIVGSSAPSRSSQEDVTPYTGETPLNPLFALLQNARADEWAMS